MKKQRKFFAALISLIMVLSFIPFNVFAGEFGEGSITLQVGIVLTDDNYSLSNVTVNGNPWTDQNDVYKTNDGEYVVNGTIHSENGKRPALIWGGNINDYMDEYGNLDIRPESETEYSFTMEVSNIGTATDDQENIINFIGLNIEAERDPVINPGDGDENPPQETTCNVDFEAASWEVKGKTVTASVEGKTLTNGPVDITLSEKIKLTGYDPLTMEPILEVIEDGFKTRLKVNDNGETSINDKEVESLPYELHFRFYIQRRTGADEEPREQKPEPNTTATVNLSSDAKYKDSYKNATIEINGYPINTEVDFGEPLPATNTAHYYYDENEDSGKVTFQFSTLFIEQYVGKIKINDEVFDVKEDILDYEDRTAWLNHYGHQTVTIEVEVDKADVYNVEVNTAEAEGKNQWIGNFLWTDNEEEKDRDVYIGHSTLELVKVVYEIDLNGNGKYEENEAVTVEGKDLFNDPYIEYDPYNETGSLVVPEGAMCTMKITPDYGYQVTSFGINGRSIITGDEISEFTFPIHKGNFHLCAEVTKVDDVVAANSEKVKSGNIKIGKNEIDSGSVVLSVNDIKLDDEKIAEFEKAAGDYTIKNYLDIDLDQVLYKGTEEDMWTERIHELKNEATITLQLEEGVDGNNIVIVHNVNDGDKYEVIEIDSYDPETNTITFKTKSFSNYAIAAKSETETTEKAAEETTSNPTTGDNIMAYVAVFAVAAVFGGIMIVKNRKNTKNKK